MELTTPARLWALTVVVVALGCAHEARKQGATDAAPAATEQVPAPVKTEAPRAVTIVPIVEAGVPELAPALVSLQARFPAIEFRLEKQRPLPNEWTVAANEQRPRQIDFGRALAQPLGSGPFVLAVTDRDGFADQWSFLFALYSPEQEQGIVSVARFREAITGALEPSAAVKEPNPEVVKLLVLQLISSTAKVIGMSGDCKVEKCVLHFPYDVSQLVKKGTEFCPAHQKEYEMLVGARDAKAAKP
jgi:hypothetical protein